MVSLQGPSSLVLHHHCHLFSAFFFVLNFLAFLAFLDLRFRYSVSLSSDESESDSSSEDRPSSENSSSSESPNILSNRFRWRIVSAASVIATTVNGVDISWFGSFERSRSSILFFMGLGMPSQKYI